MAISKHYIIEEFVPPVVHKQFGERSLWFIDQRLALFGDWLCDRFGEHATVNNWHLGGPKVNSGYRDPNCPEGAFRSAHKRGIAADYKLRNVSSEEVRSEIRKNFAELNRMFGLSTIEKDTPTWVHVDFRWTGLPSLFEVPYK